MIMGHTNYERSDFRPNSTNKMAASQLSCIRSVSNCAHWYIQWLSTSFLFIMYINYDHGSHKLWKIWFSAKFNKQNCASRPSCIPPVSNFANWYIQWLSTSFLFIMHINYDHGSHKSWKIQFSAKLAASRPSWIRSVLHTDTFNDYLQVSNALYIKLWSRVTQIMKDLIFGQIQQTKWLPVGHRREKNYATHCIMTFARQEPRQPDASTQC